MNSRKNALKTESDMNEIAEKHFFFFKCTAEKTCKKTKSENQMKGKVKAKSVTNSNVFIIRKIVQNIGRNF
jgi:hypothetical protein